MKWGRIVMYGVILYSFVNAGVVFAQDDPASDSLSTEEITKDADILERDEMYSSQVTSIPFENSMFTGDYIPQSIEESRMFRQPSEGDMISVPKELFEDKKKEAPPQAERMEPARRKRWNAVDYIFAKTRPYVFSDIGYDSNIYLVQLNKKDDIVNVTRPGMLFLIGRKDKGAESSSDRFELEGGMKVSTYAYSGFNRQHPYASARAQTGKGHYKFDFRHFFKQDFTNCSWLTDNEPGFANYLLNDTMLTGKMLYNRFGIEMRYKRISYEFKNPYKFTNNYQDNGLILSGMYRAAEMKKTAFISEFYYGKIEYTKSQFTDVNYSYYYVWLGIKGRFTKKITGLLKAGFEANNYVSKKDTTNFPVMISLNYKFSPKTTFLLGAKESGLSSANTAAGNYTGSYVTLHCLHSFTKKIGVDLGANCYIQKWHEPKRQDKGHGFSAVLEYKQNKQSRFYAEYLYSLKNSGAAHNAGFIDTRVSLRAEIIF